MPWWGFLLLAVLIVFAVVIYGHVRGRRRLFRQEFRSYLEENVDQLAIVQENRSSFIVRLGDNEGTLNLHNLMNDLFALEGDRIEDRKAVYERYANLVTESWADELLSLETHRERILPQLKPRMFFDQLTEEQELVHNELPGTDLSVAYVIDSETSVRYIAETDLRDLESSAAQLHEVALANLRERFPQEVVRRAVDGKDLVAFKAMDSYDAARALIIPEYLEEGEELAVLIPDCDTLVLASVPQDGDWAALVALAGVPASDRLLLDRPLLVTRDGFEVK